MVERGYQQREAEQIVRDRGSIAVNRLKPAQKLIEQCQQGKHIQEWRHDSTDSAEVLTIA